MSIVGAAAVPHPPVILPEVGQGREQEIQRTSDSYDAAARRIAALRPETIILSTPHSVMYADYFHISPGEGAAGDMRRFGASGVSAEVEYDTEFVRVLTEMAGEAGIPAGTFGERDSSLDHGTVIPLRFIQKYWTDFQVVRIGLSGLSPLEHYRLGKCVARTASKLNRRIVFVASGDLSHKLRQDGPYGYAPEGPEFDVQITQALGRGDFLKLLTFNEAFCDAAAECGRRSFQMMAGALDGRDVEPKLLSYEGPFGVGYAVCLFEVGGFDSTRKYDVKFLEYREALIREAREKEDPFIRLARYSLESYVQHRKQAACPDNLPEELLNHKAGVFVSIKKDGRLRGCIGTIEPVTDCVAEEILRNAVHAGTEDPRFDPVRPEELPALIYSVDVLGEPEPIQSIDQLDVVRYGVIVERGRRHGLLLPNLEGVSTPERQVSIALQKAGIAPEEEYTMQRFEVVRHECL